MKFVESSHLNEHRRTRTAIALVSLKCSCIVGLLIGVAVLILVVVLIVKLVRK